MKKFTLIILAAVTVPAPFDSSRADCTPAPDCQSLGYTQTSCPEGGIKCPWDSSKLFCNPVCNLSKSAEECAQNCLSPGDLYCVKEGKTFYSQCGTSLCGSGSSCNNGKCTCKLVGDTKIEDFKYSCTGAGYTSGKGQACNGKYTSCNCAIGYTWDGKTCKLGQQFACCDGKCYQNSNEHDYCLKAYGNDLLCSNSQIYKDCIAAGGTIEKIGCDTYLYNDFYDPGLYHPTIYNCKVK